MGAEVWDRHESIWLVHVNLEVKGEARAEDTRVEILSLEIVWQAIGMGRLTRGEKKNVRMPP